MTEILFHQVARQTAPDGMRRERAVKVKDQGFKSAERYDFETLFYEALRVGEDVILIAPRLMNFENIIWTAQFEIDQTPVSRVSIRKYYRHSVVRLIGAPPGARLDIRFASGSMAAAHIVSPQTDFLAGLNCQMTISKDNDLGRIRQQLQFHASACGVQGLVYIDNGSTTFDLSDLAAVLTTAGLAKVVLVSMPFPWGGLNQRHVHRELYLQTAAYNLVKLQFLARARAVMRFDDDEILLPMPPGQTVFDRARSARLGFVRFIGKDLYAQKKGDAADFADHDQILPGRTTSLSNWCLNPEGALGDWQWRCHDLEGNPFGRFQMLKGNFFYHCLGASTGWQSDGRHQRSGTIADMEARRFWDDVFLPVIG